MSDTKKEPHDLHPIFLIRCDCKQGSWIERGSMFRMFSQAAREAARLNQCGNPFGRVYTPIKVAPVESDE